MEMEPEMPVFVDTSLGTRLALSAPVSIMARDLKRKLKCEHISCFPTLGEIIVHSLMVKQKMNFYHIPDSMFIREACCGSRSAWFLRMNASLLANIPLQQIESPPSINHRRQKNSHQGETVCPNSKIMSPSSNDPNISTCCKVSERFLCPKLQGFRTLNDLKSPNTKVGFMVSTVTSAITKNQEGKIASDCSTCNESNIGAISLCCLDQKNLTKTVKLGENIQVNAFAKEAVGTLKTCKSVNSDVDSAKEVIQRDKTWLLEHPSKGGQDVNSSPMKEMPRANYSEEISVSGLILRYFCDNDEVNSCNIWQKVGRETAPDVYDSNYIKETSFTTKHGQYSSEERALNDPTFDDDEISKGDVSNVKKITNQCFCQAEIHLSGANKHQRPSRRRVNRKLAPVTPQSASKICQSIFNKHGITFNSNRYEVGKRLALAAKRISSSVGTKISPMSHSTSRCGNVCALGSTLVAKRCLFEISDSDH